MKATKRALADAFLDLNRGRDVGRIGVKEICARAGCARSTFYLYFSDVYDLRRYAEDELLGTVRERMGAVPLDGELEGDVVAKTAALYAEVGDGLHHFSRTDPAFGRRTREALGPYLAGWAAGLTGRERELAIEVGASALMGGLTWWYEHRDEVPAEEAIGSLRTMPFSAFHPRNGMPD